MFELNKDVLVQDFKRDNIDIDNLSIRLENVYFRIKEEEIILSFLEYHKAKYLCKGNNGSIDFSKLQISAPFRKDIKIGSSENTLKFIAEGYIDVSTATSNLTIKYIQVLHPRWFSPRLDLKEGNNLEALGYTLNITQRKPKNVSDRNINKP